MQPSAVMRRHGELVLTTETEKATPSDEGASIEDRLERLFATEEAPKDVKQPAATQAADNVAGDDKPDEGGAEDADQPQLSTTDFAKLLGVDESALTLDEDGSVKFKTKIDGAEGAAKLADVLKSYQLEGHVNKRSMELAEREKAQQAKAQEVEQQFAQRLQYAERLNAVAARQLMNEFQSINWQALEQQDPGTAALYRQKFQERDAQLRQVDQAIQQERAQNAEKAKGEKLEKLRKEASRLEVLIPEWKDQAIANKEKAEISDWAQKAGYEPEEMEVLTSTARNVQLLRKAMLADRLAAKRPEIENKVRKAPVLVKPGQPTSAESSKAQGLQNLKTAVKKSGGKSDAVEAWLLAAGKV